VRKVMYITVMMKDVNYFVFENCLSVCTCTFLRIKLFEREKISFKSLLEREKYFDIEVSKMYKDALARLRLGVSKLKTHRCRYQLANRAHSASKTMRAKDMSLSNVHSTATSDRGTSQEGNENIFLSMSWSQN